MKKYFIAFIICFASPFNLSAQLNLAWQSIIDDGASGNENAEISVNDPNGYVYTIGTMRPWGFNSSDLVIVKYDAMGNELWRTFYAGPSGKSEKINDAVLDQNGDLILCGEYFNVSNKNDILVMKYSSIGGFMWMDTIDGTNATYDQGFAVCVDDANNYYFTGYTSSGSIKGRLLKYSPSGQQLWSAVYTGTQQGTGLSFYENYIYLTCMTGPTGSPSHASLMKLDTSGTLISAVNLNMYNGDQISDVLFRDDKIYIVDARSYSAPAGSQFGIVCADTSMQVIWDKNFNAGYNSTPVGISIHDTVLYAVYTEYANSNYTPSAVKVRGISCLTGDSLFSTTCFTQGSQNDVALAQRMDANGTLSVLLTYEIAPTVDRFQLTRIDAAGVQTGGHLFYDIPGFGDATILQAGLNEVIINATVYDSIANNTNISTWKFTTGSVGLSTANPKTRLVAGPVPAKEYLQLFGLPVGSFRYEILSCDGRLVNRGELSAGDVQLSLSMQRGYYFLKVYGESEIYSTSFIKE